ncbi:cold shock domain-containing protein [Ilumatobacter sp.]|uniref:cold shock domain-containing protein n=1 Tax=Ilumatobacter sp. TaxID=1967498 RepID=UPI003B52D02F
MTELGRARRRRGTVAEFDAGSGLGVVEAADGSRYAFHCVEIADGSREVEVGAAVSFDLLAKFGRYEAAHLTT